MAKPFEIKIKFSVVDFTLCTVHKSKQYMDLSNNKLNMDEWVNRFGWKYNTFTNLLIQKDVVDL